jgi:hypothetical protein
MLALAANIFILSSLPMTSRHTPDIQNMEAPSIHAQIPASSARTNCAWNVPNAERLCTQHYRMVDPPAHTQWKHY